MAGADGGADRLRYIAQQLRETQAWCDERIATHAQFIGTGIGPQPRATAVTLVRRLALMGLGDIGAEINVDAWSTHQLVVGLLTKFGKAVAASIWHVEQGDESAPAILISTFAKIASPPSDSTKNQSQVITEDAGNAAMAREVAEWCKTESQAMRALLQNGDPGPDVCRTVVGKLIRMLSHAGQSALRDSIGQEFATSTYDNPLPVLGLLSRVQGALEPPAKEPHGTAAINSEPKPAEPRSIAPGPSPESDGPHPPNRLLFGGTEVTLEPVPWRLAGFMWERQRAAADDVCQHVWGEDSPGEVAVKVAQNKANRALKQLGAPWRISSKAGYFVKRPV